MPLLELVPTVARLFPQAEEAMRRPAISHRSPEFQCVFEELLHNLKQLSGNRFSPIVACGSGSFANELMVWNYARDAKSVLVLTNGEFGNRLAAKAKACCGDRAEVLDFGWGTHFSVDLLRERLKSMPVCELILCVACETSWGGVTDLAAIDSVAQEYHVPVALDAMSAVGFTPEIFSYGSVCAVSGSSGKCLAGIPGIALLFCRESVLPIESNNGIPDMFNIHAHLAAMKKGMPVNTLSSILVQTLNASIGAILEIGETNYRERLVAVKHKVVLQMQHFGFYPFPGSDSPMITAFMPPENLSLRDAFFDHLRKKSIRIYTQPAYLRERDLCEIAHMGDFTKTLLQIL